MKYGVDIPNFGYWAHPRRVAEFAKQVEDAGWDENITPASLTEILSHVREHRTTDAPFDVTVPGTALADPDSAVDTIAALGEAGMTWWREGWAPDSQGTVEDWHERVLAGPPR